MPRTLSEPDPFLFPLTSLCCDFFSLQRSLGVLAELFGGGKATPARPVVEAISASSAPVPAPKSGGAGVYNIDGAKLASPLVAESTETQEKEAVPPKTHEEQQRQRPAPPDEGETTPPEAEGAAESKAEGPGEMRFVAHMSTLTDIFKVKDKVSTKKSTEEKQKDRGFKVASLFDRLAGAEGPQPAPAAAAAAAGPASTSGGFSFSFDGSVAGATSARTDDREDARTVISTGGQSHPAPSPQPSSDLPTVSCFPTSNGLAGNPGSQSRPGLTSPSAPSALGRTELALWRPLGDVVAVAARFVRTGKREDVEAAWLGERRALTQDFKRKHKDAVKGRKGSGAGGAASKARKR